MSLRKVAQYKEEIEKVASRAWKRNLAKIGEKGIDKLVDSGVLDRQKELKGLRRGTNAILGKHNAKMVRKSEHAAGMLTRKTKENAVKQGISFNNEDIEDVKRQIKGMGAFGTPEGKIKGMKHEALAHTTKKADKDIRKVINPSIQDINENKEMYGLKKRIKELKSTPKKDRDAKKWTQAILERHEADEIRFGKKVLDNKKKHINTEAGKASLAQMSSHLTPKVLMAESANVALAPKGTKDKFKHLRNWNQSVSGYKNTEMGTLKELTGNKLQYGKSGVFDKKLANKAENKLVNRTKNQYRDMGYIE